MKKARKGLIKNLTYLCLVGVVALGLMTIIGTGGGGGGGDSNGPTATEIPSAPTDATASAGDGQVTISWSAVSGATSYNIYWSETSGVTKDNGTQIPDITSPYSHTGLTNGTTYYYVVTAVNSFGESAESAEVSAAPTDESVWSIQTIDPVNAANGDISAAIDTNNAIHVCYFNFNNGLKYATNKTGTWVSTYIQEEDVNTTVSSGDIAVDGNNNVHIVYNTGLLSSPYTAALYYATNSSGSWIKTKLVETVNPWTGGFSGSGIIATSNGKVHIAFGNSDMELRYLNNISGSWSAPIEIYSYWTSVRPRLALDSDDNVYIAHEHGGEGSLWLGVVNSSGSFVGNTLLDGPGYSGTGRSTGWSPNIAFDKASDSQNRSYWDEDNQSLKLYSADGLTTIDSYETGYWPYSGIALDQNGKVYISFSDAGSSELRYATNKSGSWVVETLAPLSDSSHSDIVIESTGKIDLIYCNKGTNSLNVISKQLINLYLLD